MIKGGVAGLSLSIMLLGAVGSAPAAVSDPTSRCSALQAPLIQGLVVESDLLVPAGTVRSERLGQTLSDPRYDALRRWPIDRPV
jgi:hypothetical protein